MRIRIIIDTQDADEPEAIDTPFTLNVHKDDDDGTPSRVPLHIAGEDCLIGNDIGAMLHELARAWKASAVLGQDDEPLARSAAEWRAEGAGL